ncbi:hypothetical protein CEXT_370551 [Caerostris extrusa]|uniref:Uncharacterized protein n=1 Tax=Caerostris extrusa TaxID=172846 RepID=A0AAV4Y167_CAEEX|nr:hypothetical protein CEXT_370551 [Caerostris extrusa]
MWILDLFLDSFDFAEAGLCWGRPGKLDLEPGSRRGYSPSPRCPPAKGETHLGHSAADLINASQRKRCFVVELYSGDLFLDQEKTFFCFDCRCLNC